MLYFHKLFPRISYPLKTVESDLIKKQTNISICVILSRRMFNTKISKSPWIKPAVWSCLNVKYLSLRFLISLLGFSCNQGKVWHNQLQRLFEKVINWDSCKNLVEAVINFCRYIFFKFNGGWSGFKAAPFFPLKISENVYLEFIFYRRPQCHGLE